MGMPTRFRPVRKCVALAIPALALALAACGDEVTNIVEPALTLPSGPSIYGDGSAGARTISADTTLAEPNPQFTDFTVSAGVTLTVESGTVIRCTGTFRNDGTIVVGFGAEGSDQRGFGGLDVSYTPAEAGVALRAPAPGEYGDNAGIRIGGVGGIGVSEYQARMILRPGPKAGSGSGGAYSAPGKRGGGSLVVLARVSVHNGGVIAADGEDASTRCGGGAGGIVILASADSVANTGTINANGGDGGANDTFAGRGGGGGGGIIHFLAPTVNNGAANVHGGQGGAAAGNVTQSPRQGGGGGGACGGAGGDGGLVALSNTPAAGAAGASGYVIVTAADPGSLFLSTTPR